MAKYVIFENGNKPQSRLGDDRPSDGKKQVEKLETIVRASQDILYECSGVWPFDFFPNKIIVDKTKVTIIENMFMFKRTFPIPIKDIQTVKTIQGFLFSSFSMEVRGYEDNPPDVGRLWPGAAKKAREYILGLMAARSEGVDLSVIPEDTTKKNLRKIGKTMTE